MQPNVEAADVKGGYGTMLQHNEEASSANQEPPGNASLLLQTNKDLEKIVVLWMWQQWFQIILVQLYDHIMN